MSAKIKIWLPVALLGLAVALAWGFGADRLFSLEFVQVHRGALLEFASERRLAAAALFSALYIIAAALSLPVAGILSLLGGFLFGRGLGTLLIVISATAGATVVFFVARSALGGFLREKAGTAYEKMRANLQKNEAGYLLFLRLVPVFPFWLVNIAAAGLSVRPRIFVLTTLFGIIPGSFIYANLGRELGRIENLAGLLSFPVLIALSLLGFIALLPGFYMRITRGKV